MDIKIDDLQSKQVICLLEEHLGDMYGTSPEESVHALDVDALRALEPGRPHEQIKVTF